MSEHRVAIVAGARTPFVKAGKAFASLGPLALAKHAARGLLDRHAVEPASIEAIAFGVVVPERGKPNLAREIVLETGLPAAIEAQTVSSYCITGVRTATIIADAIARGRIAFGVAARERLAGEIVPVEGVEHDTGPRADTSLGRLAPVFDPAGTLTARRQARRGLISICAAGGMAGAFLLTRS